MGLFGTSGIRGVFGTEVTPELALRVGQALGSKSSWVLVGRDTRPSGMVLEQALCAGILSAGAEPFKLGIVSTPSLGLATRKFSCAGAMITASHNPPEYNGIKIFSNGAEATVQMENDIEKFVKAKENKTNIADWKKLKSTGCYDNAVRDHIDLALSNVDVSLISRKRPKVLVDAGNGAASVISPFALREAGCRVVGVNCEPSGMFARKLEPNAENLADFCKMVRACGADMGIAHDGDGDRAIVVDEKGRMVGLDAQLALMCEHELEISGNKNSLIVTTVEASLAVREACERRGAKVEIVPVGSRGVGERVVKRSGVFGGEPCGEYVYPKSSCLADGTLAALKFVELFCRKGSLAKLRDSVKTYPIMRGKYAAKDKHDAMKKIAGEMAKLKGKRNTEDGVRVDMEHGWVLVRASGTEPIVRITCEARSEKECREIYAQAERIVKKSV